MSAASDVSSKLLAWLMAGSGTVLLYAAYKNRSPLDILRDVDSGPAFTTTLALGDTSSLSDSTGGYSGSTARLRMIANREMEPDLVSIRPNGKLDREAAASLERIFAKLGYVVPNVGSHRSFVTQAAAFYDNNEILSDGSRRYGNPNKSLHVVGLAIDLHADYMNRSDVVEAFTAEGWQRPRPSAEPWHWSFGVRG